MFGLPLVVKAATIVSSLLIFAPLAFPQDPTALPTTLSTNPLYYSTAGQSDYTWNRLYPQSCECVEGGVAKTACDLYKCSCTCDVTAGVCDYNCCCDPDCSDAQLSRFESLGVCSFEGADSDTTTYCYSSTELYGINPRPPMGGQSSAQEALGQALCVVKKNYAFEGQFFNSEHAQLVPQSVFDESAGTKPYSYTESDVTKLVSDQYYDQNDTIAAFYGVSIEDKKTVSLVSNGPGYMQIPSTDHSGYCNDADYATFENNVAPRTCQRPLSEEVTVFSEQCTSQFSVGRYVNNLWIARFAQVSAIGGSTPSANTDNVQLSSVMYLDTYTQESRTVTNDYWVSNNCNTRAMATSDINQTDACLFASDESKAAYLNNSQQFCNNFVHEVVYEVSHSVTGNFHITLVTAKVIITDVPMPSSIPASFPQSFGVTYTSSSRMFSQDNGNQVPRQKSGNPGYLMGYPVLFGYKEANTVSELITGLDIPSPIFASVSPHSAANLATGGACPVSLSEFSTYLSSSVQQQETVQLFGSSTVLFGYDVSSGCSMKVNRLQMEELCCVKSDNCVPRTSPYYSPYVDSKGLPYFFRNSSGLIGIYGNADPLDLSQWEPLTYAIPLSAGSSSRGWKAASSTCTGMPTNMVIEFLVASSGEKMNPQNKIISARARVLTSDIVMKVPVGDSLSTQTVPLIVTVSFVFQDEEQVIGYAPPAPPVLFQVPANIFHPFTGLISASPKTSALSLTLSATCLLVAVGLMYGL